MKLHFYLLAAMPVVFTGCAHRHTVTTTTTEVRQEVVQKRGKHVTSREVMVTRTPPVVRVETQTRSPGANYVWTRGYWRWTGAEYVWVSGSWVARPRPAAVWVEGEWQRRPAGWIWIAGHWQS